MRARMAATAPRCRMSSLPSWARVLCLREVLGHLQGWAGEGRVQVGEGCLKEWWHGDDAEGEGRVGRQESRQAARQAGNARWQAGSQPCRQEKAGMQAGKAGM